MNLLFLHQNFPGQFRHAATRFASQGHRVLAIHEGDPRPLAGVEAHGYRLARGNTPGQHQLAQEFESKVLRGEGAAEVALRLHAQGFRPDLIFAHPGWGEALYIKEVFPEARLVCLMEFYYRSRGQDMGFDPEFPTPSFHQAARLHTKNANLLLAMEAMDLGVAATDWQRSTLPAWAAAKTAVIHEGIDTQEVAPDPRAEISLPDRGVRICAGDEVLTFVARNLEPVRGYHVFMRALPAILKARPQARVFIVGGDDVSYGARPEVGSYRQQYLTEVGHLLDPERVFFLGKVPRSAFIRLMQITRCHIYLTYPFVLSWSMLEAMSAGALVVGSATAPVTEVIEHGVNGLLTGFFDVEGLARTAIEALAEPVRFAALRESARQTILDRYDLERITLPAYERLLGEVSGR